MVSFVDLYTAVSGIFRSAWTIRRGQSVPRVQDLALEGNEGTVLNACVMYADLSDSTGLVDRYDARFAAGIYKSYMHCAGKIIRDAGGSITAYDGDRVMAIFLGIGKEQAAVLAAMRIHHLLTMVLWPTLGECYPAESYRPSHTIGIDSSDLLAVRIGVRSGSDIGNDIVWVGSAANHAAKLCAEKLVNPIRVSPRAFQHLGAGYLVYQDQQMWKYERAPGTGFDRFTSNWWMAQWYTP